MKFCRGRIRVEPEDITVHRRYLVTVRVWSDRDGETAEDLSAAARSAVGAASNAIRKREHRRWARLRAAWDSMYGASS